MKCRIFHRIVCGPLCTLYAGSIRSAAQEPKCIHSHLAVFGNEPTSKWFAQSAHVADTILMFLCSFLICLAVLFCLAGWAMLEAYCIRYGLHLFEYYAIFAIRIFFSSLYFASAEYSFQLCICLLRVSFFLLIFRYSVSFLAFSIMQFFGECTFSSSIMYYCMHIFRPSRASRTLHMISK